MAYDTHGRYRRLSGSLKMAPLSALERSLPYDSFAVEHLGIDRHRRHVDFGNQFSEPACIALICKLQQPALRYHFNRTSPQHTNVANSLICRPYFVKRVYMETPVVVPKATSLQEYRIPSMLSVHLAMAREPIKPLKQRCTGNEWPVITLCC